jgi:endonuclease/exonuclease/phosphatase (EEP) superfamily protein YafD
MALAAAMHRLTRLAVVCVALLGLLTLLGLLSPLDWLADRAADLRVQTTLALGLLAVALGTTRHLRIAAGTTGLALVNLLVLWPLLSPGLRPLAPAWWPPALLPRMVTLPQGVPDELGPQLPLRVMSTNVWYRNRDYAAVRAAVRAGGPDIAVFLEVTPRWAQELAMLRDLWPYQRWVPGVGHDAVMVISRWPWHSATPVVLGRAGDADAVRVTVMPGGHPLDILGVHLRWPVTPVTAAARARALASLAGLARTSQRPLIILGDLNLTPHDGQFARLLAVGRLRNGAAAAGLVTTWPAWARLAGQQVPGLQLDHCLYSRGLTLEQFALGPRVGSDHWPILATLLVPARRHGPAPAHSTFQP